jgi:hypothetical protein
VILLKDKISVDLLKPIAESMYGKLVKSVVDLKQNFMVVDMEMHADGERFLLEEMESTQEDLWGINLRPNLFPGEDWVEFDSMVNLRPSWGNFSRGVESPITQAKIRTMVDLWIQK